MRTFLIIWLGQLVSTIGSRMTSFALEIWAWEITGEATTQKTYYEELSAIALAALIDPLELYNFIHNDCSFRLD